MARQRDPRRDEAFQIWKEHNGEIKLKDIAAQLSVGEGTLRGWKNKDSWDEKLNGTFHLNKKSAPSKKTERSENKGGAPPGNKNAVGNKGGAPLENTNAVGHGAPLRNTNSLKHGFYRKHMPPEVMEIVDKLQADGIDHLDMLWGNILIQFANLMHSQKVMFVKDKDDMTKVIKKVKGLIGEDQKIKLAEEIEYEIQHAGDKQANLLAAHARASAELRNHIKDFLLLSGEDDLRRLQLQKMQKEMEKTNIELEILKAGDNKDVTELVVRRWSKDAADS